jgi:hypothetical protein
MLRERVHGQYADHVTLLHSASVEHTQSYEGTLLIGLLVEALNLRLAYITVYMLSMILAHSYCACYNSFFDNRVRAVTCIKQQIKRTAHGYIRSLYSSRRTGASCSSILRE